MERDGTARNGTNRCGTERKWAGRAGISYAPAALTSPPFFGKPASDAPFSRAAGAQNCPPLFHAPPALLLSLFCARCAIFAPLLFRRACDALLLPHFLAAPALREPPHFFGAPTARNFRAPAVHYFPHSACCAPAARSFRAMCFFMRSRRSISSLFLWRACGAQKLPQFFDRA